MIQYKEEPKLFQQSQLEAINSIATDFISSLGYNLEIKCYFIDDERSPISAGVYFEDTPLVLTLNEPLLLIGTPNKPYEDERIRAIYIVDTILHECCHLITRETDEKYNFEKMIYDLDISSNLITQDPKYLQKLLKLSDEEIQGYIQNRKSNFENKYSKYINEFLNA